MTSIAVLGATGNLGRHVAMQALAANLTLAVGVRNRSRLAPEVAAQAQITELDLYAATPDQIAYFAGGHDAFVFCAGHVSEGASFVGMFDKVVQALESLPAEQRPVCWFLAGAALLPLDATGRLGMELPKASDTYWPHLQNFKRLQRSCLDWRLLCPGPMVNQPPVGLEQLRITFDTLPMPLPSISHHLPAPLLLPMLAMKIPEMIISYADAASVVLAHIEPQGPVSRRRVGIALPVGMRGRKDHWAAQPRTH